MEKVKIEERGWGGHFVLSYKCLFRRNTLLTYQDIKIVVSTIGILIKDISKRPFEFDSLLDNRYFETMAFHAKDNDLRYNDADIGRQIKFESPWKIDKIDADDEANIMHENVVKEITKKLLRAEKFNS